MKKIQVLMVLGLMLLFPAQMSQASESVYGLFYKNATEAGDGFSNVAAYKKGKATCKSYIGLVGLGDCSITAAAKDGKIKNIAYYDIHTRNILGYKKVTTTVYGN